MSTDTQHVAVLASSQGGGIFHGYDTNLNFLSWFIHLSLVFSAMLHGHIFLSKKHNHNQLLLVSYIFRDRSTKGGHFTKNYSISAFASLWPYIWLFTPAIIRPYHRFHTSSVKISVYGWVFPDKSMLSKLVFVCVCVGGGGGTHFLIPACFCSLWKSTSVSAVR